MQKLKCDTNELLYDTETDSTTQSRHVVAKEDGVREGLGVWD